MAVVALDFNAIPAVQASVAFGTGANGTVTVTAVTPIGVDGNGIEIIYEVADAADVATYAIYNPAGGGTITLSQGTDVGGAYDATLNTATLVAAAIGALPGFSAVASGTGADEVVHGDPSYFLAGGVDAPGTAIEISGAGLGLSLVNALTDAVSVSIVSTNPVLGVNNGVLAAATVFKVTAEGGVDLNPVLAGPGGFGIAGNGLLGVGMLLVTNPAPPVRVTARACLDPGRTALGACDVVREILMLWGIEDISIAPGFARRRALHDLNAAMQEVWNHARDRNYWTRSTASISFAEGVHSSTMANAVQNVIGPARTNYGRPLVPLGSRGELDQFEMLYLEGPPPEEPVAYYIERKHQSGSDPAQCIMHIRPAAPEGGTAVSLDVVNEAPRYSWNDVDNCTVIPIPHRYVESLLLPVARYHAMGCHLFIARDLTPGIESAYQAARGQLDSADPLPAKSGDNTNRREEART